MRTVQTTRADQRFSKWHRPTAGCSGRRCAPPLNRSVVRTTQIAVCSEHNDAPEHPPATWLRSGGGSGRVGRAWQLWRSSAVLKRASGEARAVKHALQYVVGRPLGVGPNRGSGVVAVHLPGWSRKPSPSTPPRWRRNAERTRSVGCHESDVDFSRLPDFARSPHVAVAASEGNVSAKPSNKPMKLTVRSVTQLAGASCAPDRPATYRHR
jgi:hypothetical protein